MYMISEVGVLDSGFEDVFRFAGWGGALKALDKQQFRFERKRVWSLGGLYTSPKP